MTELVTTFSNEPQAQLVAWADAARAASGLATSLVQTNVCPPAFRNKPQEATAVILLGAELGLSPIAALRSMFDIRGQLGMYVRAQLALVQSRGHRIWTLSESDDAVTVQGHRAGDPEHVEEVTWTIARARQAGFIRRGRDGAASQYELQPRAMLWARAAGDVARRIAADVLAGVPELDDPSDSPQALSGAAASSGRVIQRQRPAPAPRYEIDPATAPDVSELVELPGDPPPQESLDSGGSEPTLPADDVEPEPDVEPDVEPTLTPAQLRALQALFVQVSVRGPEARHRYLSTWLGRPIESTNDLTVTEASAVIDRLQTQVNSDG